VERLNKALEAVRHSEYDITGKQLATEEEARWVGCIQFNRIPLNWWRAMCAHIITTLATESGWATTQLHAAASYTCELYTST
jgi:hypothetical protein